MKARKLTLLLPLVHFLIAGVLIGSEESKHWRLHVSDVERIGRIERRENEHTQHSIQSKVSEENEAAFQESIAMEYLPSSETSSVYGVGLPAAVVIGWFWHPLTAHFGGVLQPLLIKLTLGSSAVPRVLFLDFLLILAICGQWCLAGYWLDKRKRQSKPIGFQWNLVVTITIAGFVAAIFCRAGGELDFFAALAAFCATIAWLALLLNAALAVGTSAHTLVKQAIAKADWLRANG